MIKVILLLFWSLAALASGPSYWSHLTGIAEQHEFYQSNEEILKPKDSWQSLFAFSYFDKNVQSLKDCVFFKVPGSDAGELKIKTISSFEKCDAYLLKEGDILLKEIKSLIFNQGDRKVIFEITLNDFKSIKWEAQFQDTFKRPTTRMNLSSAEFKSPKIILLASRQKDKSTPKQNFLKQKTLCHDINEDCDEARASTCDECSNGWYEIPNGCDRGPKFCGTQDCGKKNGPACRRGTKWQQVEVTNDCRTDSSFAYCAEGLTVHCEGKKAFCR